MPKGKAKGKAKNIGPLSSLTQQQRRTMLASEPPPITVNCDDPHDRAFAGLAQLNCDDGRREAGHRHRATASHISPHVHPSCNEQCYHNSYRIFRLRLVYYGMGLK